MAIRGYLQSNRGTSGQRPQDKHVNPGLWKLVTAAAAILILLVVSIELFKQPDASLVSKPEHQSVSH
ncbi:hypothetical protein E2F50_05780 [Rhizobium deserti]|uniref:Uncharacterized protein n=1 Tax=Rhizobium deserti TaxID=2547961 RepID=A0A4R5UNW7_9HYPH|nr:hypothetical protein [Rhizobium deserti]TDK39616.1 hypothetical protein E2F50_05780 [Rhizobium deserti]